MASIQVRVSKSNLTNLIKDLERYTTVLKKNGNKIVKQMAEFGAEEARMNFEDAEYDGVKDFVVNVKPRNNGGYMITAGGESVWFLEYGTGMFTGEDYPGPLPPGAVRGSYGRGQGAKEYWYFYSKEEPELTATGSIAMGTHKVVKGTLNKRNIEKMKLVEEKYPKDNSYITNGNPPCAAMYHAREAMEDEFKFLAQEILSKK